MAVPDMKGIEYFARTKRSSPKKISAFTEMWAADQKRNQAYAAFAGDWLPNMVEVPPGRYERTPASEVLVSYANGDFVKVSNEIARAGTHKVQQIYAFANQKLIESGKDVEEMVIVADVRHSLTTGPWEKHPLIWWSVDEAKVIKQPNGGAAILDVKNGSFEMVVAANKYFDERAEGYANLDNAGVDVIPMYWEPEHNDGRKGVWNVDSIYSWIDAERAELIKKRKAELERLMAVPSSELSKADFAKRFQAQMGR